MNVVNDDRVNIVRATKDKDHPYVMVRRSIVDGSTLTLEERATLIYILSKPDTWKVQPKDLQREGGIGRDKAYAILNGLISKGYCQRFEERDPKTRKVVGYRYVVYEEPLPENTEAGMPLTEKPEAVQVEPLPGLPYPANQDISNKGIVVRKKDVVPTLLPAELPEAEPTPPPTPAPPAVPAKHRAPKAKAAPKMPEGYGEMFVAVKRLCYGIEKTEMPPQADRNARDTAKYLLTIGATPADVVQWHKQEWVPQWRAKRPFPTQMQVGVAAYMEANIPAPDNGSIELIALPNEFEDAFNLFQLGGHNEQVHSALG